VFAVLVAVLAGSGCLIGLEKPGATQPETLSRAPLGLIAGKPGSLTCLEPRRCSGFLAGSDGTALDTDLILPDADHYPLVVQVHGWGGNKGTGDPITTYPGDRFLTDRGYAVLRYSARGFGKSWGQTELGASDREIADLRILVSTIVDDSRFRVLPDRIAVMGASYGGHHAWAAAATRPAWATPEGRAVRIAAVVPVVGWTDLRSSLLPNGNESDLWSPVGTPKLSYLLALNAIGTRFDPERPYPNYLPLLALMLGRAIAGEPFQVGNVTEPTAASLGEFLEARSPANRAAWFDTLRANRSAWVPILAIQAWTDDLFPAGEGTRVVRRLKEVSPDYPVKLYIGDTGHPRAGNSVAELSAIHTLISDWLGWWLKDEGRPPTFDVTSATTIPGQYDPSLVVTTRTLDELSTGRVATSFGGPYALINQPVQLGGLAADPSLTRLFVNPLTNRLPFPGDAGGASMVKPVAELAGGKAVWYMGFAQVILTGTIVGVDAQYDIRLWDQDERGQSLLVDRGTTKFVGGPGPVRAQVDLAGNAWRFPPGHKLVLEVTNADMPFLRPDTLPSSTILQNVTIALPVRALDAPARYKADDAGPAKVRKPPAASPKPAPAADVGATHTDAHPPAGELITQETAGSTSVHAVPPEPGRSGKRPLAAALISAPFLLAIAVAVLRGRGTRA
jgi:ABC-2 type transport system ATP-binding protein